jgi:hypothetical protein
MNRSRKTTIIYAVIGATVMFLVSATVFADQEKFGIDREDNATAASEKSADLSGFAHSKGRKWRVRCDRGEKLSRALYHARENDTIRFSGICYESVVVITDKLSIEGYNGATIDGSQTSSEAVLLVDGARNLSLSGFTVQNGSDQGILFTHQAQGKLSNIKAQNNATEGLSVDRSHLDIENLVLDNNSGGGMDAYTGSTVVAKGTLSAQGNGGDGLVANGLTFFELRGATVMASGNAGSGVSIINDSRLQIFSFPEAQGSSITADNNGFAGIGILGARLGVVGSQYFGSGANVISASNNIIGFFAPAGAILSPHATAKFVASNNGVGLLLEDGASALIVGGLNLTQNGAGISANGAGTLTLVSVPPNPSTVDNNAADLDLGFGTRATIDGVAHTTLYCDGTALVRGATCQ